MMDLSKYLTHNLTKASAPSTRKLYRVSATPRNIEIAGYRHRDNDVNNMTTILNYMVNNVRQAHTREPSVEMYYDITKAYHP